MPDCWLEVSIRKVLRPATWAQVFFLFSCVHKLMLRWFPRLQVATACFSWSPPDLNFLDPWFIFMCMYYNHCHRETAHLGQLSVLLLLLLLLLLYDMDVSCHRHFLPGTSLETAVNPTAQASSFTLLHTAVLSVLCVMFQV
jgi:hypothetical protein